MNILLLSVRRRSAEPRLCNAMMCPRVRRRERTTPSGEHIRCFWRCRSTVSSQINIKPPEKDGTEVESGGGEFMLLLQQPIMCENIFLIKTRTLIFRSPGTWPPIGTHPNNIQQQSDEQTKGRQERQRRLGGRAAMMTVQPCEWYISRKQHPQNKEHGKNIL